MHRAKKILFTAHCILNQNAVIRQWERAKGGFNTFIQKTLENNISIVQLPCPEFTFLGEDRPPMTKQEYDTEAYRRHSREILGIILKQFQEYLNHGYQIVGILGIQGSPSCDTLKQKGVFMEELLAMLGEQGTHVKTFDVPEDYLEGEEHYILKEFQEFIHQQ
ncbi:Predicted secreted protein [Geosporobacter subterraneus DSM 17957]|uniref:Predicted secreted protein n=2 Tax=Geosporobacter TaxID=390805 RepID=A0A1M6QVH0_9FIRM|nr:Predicted secreted protein [Geosporobacter subterraneus DSM 17957]